MVPTVPGFGPPGPATEVPVVPRGPRGVLAARPFTMVSKDLATIVSAGGGANHRPALDSATTGTEAYIAYNALILQGQLGREAPTTIKLGMAVAIS